ncbi:MAG: alpha/beta-type small acid-soluble spore protein [Tissierellaceae bacterium]|nr:alpha/beta-type small acid-soluble spore protein [Tissierellaceae bacterium]
MANGPLDPNARRALNEMKMEIANEMGVQDNLNNNINPINNIFTAGPVGGIMTRKLVEMGEQQLIDKNK